MILFPEAKFTLSTGRIEWGTSVHHTPIQSEGDMRLVPLQSVPDVLAKAGLMEVRIFKRSLVRPLPLFELHSCSCLCPSDIVVKSSDGGFVH